MNLNDNGTEIQSQIAKNLTKTGLTILFKPHISNLPTTKEGLKQT